MSERCTGHDAREAGAVLMGRARLGALLSHSAARVAPASSAVAQSRPNRVLPVVGLSFTELGDAGINPRVAEQLCLPVDAARTRAYNSSVSALGDFVRSAR
jgi:ribosomal protein L13E